MLERVHPELDRAGLESTHVVTTVLRGLLRAAPRSEILPALREALADGAISDPRREHLRCWGYRLQPPYGRPSPLHTAQAVVALDRAARVLGETPTPAPPGPGPPARTASAGCCPARTHRTTPARIWRTCTRRYAARARTTFHATRC